jgi:hypothetical protein
MPTAKFPGFPDVVTAPIALPDMGELLLYPAFQTIEADKFLQYASDFQKSLFDKVPLCHDRRIVAVSAAVWLLRPGTRSHVTRAGRNGWHVDGSTFTSHLFPDDRIYILSSPCSCLTQFNENPIEIPVLTNESSREFCQRIDSDPSRYGIQGRSIEPCRIYMFQNHIHRAVDPTRVEFRFFLRVRETDEQIQTTSSPMKKVYLGDADSGARHLHIEYQEDRVSILFPSLVSS